MDWKNFLKKEWLFDENTKQVIDSLTQGNIWEGEIKYPCAIIICLLNYFDKFQDIREDKRFSINLVTILSFYNLQQEFINKNIIPGPAKYVRLEKNDN